MFRLPFLFVILISIFSLVVGVYYNNIWSIVVGGIVLVLFGLIPSLFFIVGRVTEMIEAHHAYQQHHPIGTHVYFPTIPRKSYGTVTGHDGYYDYINFNNGTQTYHRAGKALKHSTGRRPPNGQLETIMEKFHDGKQRTAVARGTSRFPDEATAKIGAMLFGLNEGQLLSRLNTKNERERTEMEQREREERERESVATSASTPLLRNYNNGIEMLTLANSPRRSTDAKKRSKISRRRK